MNLGPAGLGVWRVAKHGPAPSPGRTRGVVECGSAAPAELPLSSPSPEDQTSPPHSAQWEFYQVLQGRGEVPHQKGMTEIEPGDVFLFPPDEPHQLINDGSEDLVVCIIADIPIGESCHYPDSGKWVVRSPERRLIRSEPLDDYDGEE